MHGFEGMGFGMVWGWLIGILILVIIIWAITKGINATNNPPINTKVSAIEILKKRYAKGEINKEEFEEKKNILES